MLDQLVQAEHILEPLHLFDCHVLRRSGWLPTMLAPSLFQRRSPLTVPSLLFLDDGGDHVAHIFRREPFDETINRGSSAPLTGPLSTSSASLAHENLNRQNPL